MGGSLDIEDHAPVFGTPAFTVDLGCESAPVVRAPGSILIGLDRRGALPVVDVADYDLLADHGGGGAAALGRCLSGVDR